MRISGVAESIVCESCVSVGEELVVLQSAYEEQRVELIENRTLAHFYVVSIRMPSTGSCG